MTPKSRPRKQMIFLTPKEFLALLRTAKAHGSREHAMILMAYAHGLRANEVCRLKLTDIDLRSQEISTERQKNSAPCAQPLHVHRGEPLLDELKVIRRYLDERKDDGSGVLFVSQKGGQMTRQHFHALFQQLAREAGIPESKRHPHTLKHSLASHLIAANTNLAVVQRQLGHRSISSTMAYIGVSDEQVASETKSALMRVFA